MARPQPREPSLLADMRTSFNILVFVVDVHTACLRPFTRSGMGIRGLGAPAFWAMLCLPVYAAMTESEAMLTFWYAWMAMAVWRRITADRRQHTDFQGWVWPFACCVRNELMARRLEAVSMWLIGNWLSARSEPLGLFVSFGFLSFGTRCVIDAMALARRREAAHNARIEMEAMQRYVD